MIRKLWAFLSFVLTLAVSMTAGAQEAPAARGQPGPGPATSPELPADAREAIGRGLEYLKRTQDRFGAWRGGEYKVAVTALCGLALLASGSTPASGPHSENVRGAVNYLVTHQLHSGLFFEANDSRPMYGHGFALLFLAGCYGAAGPLPTERPLDRAIRDAIALTSRVQSAAGGWYYTPTSEEDEGSVTISQIQGLRAARNAGFKVDRRVIDRAIGYIHESQEADGGIRYTSRYGRSSLALTGAGLSVLFGAGEYEGKSVETAIDYCRARMETGPETPHFHYTHFYLAQAMFQRGGSDWEAYYPRIRAELVRSRSSEGYWSSTYGRAYATALALLILEIPYRYLPIYER